MKKLFLVALTAMTCLFSSGYAQDFGIKFSGYVKTDMFYDSRQVVSSRDGHFMLLPEKEVSDINGKDINAKGNFNFLSIQSRITGKITAPDFMGGKTSGILEGEFFGTSDADINGFRLRHAFVKVDWTNTSLLIGQFWNPLFQQEIFADVISFNTGAPFQPFARNPQIRLTQKMEDFYVSLSLASQRDFVSTGPLGGSTSYLRNAGMPIVSIDAKYKLDNKVVIGATGSFKTIKPLILTSKNSLNDKTLSSIAAGAYCKFWGDDYSVMAQGYYGGNMFDLSMLGGYGTKTIDPVTGVEDFSDIKAMSAYADFSYGKGLQFGLFAGVSKNLGSADNLVATKTYGRGLNVDMLYRVSPRVSYQDGKVKFALEFEHTNAAYGTPDSKFVVKDTKNIANERILLSAILFF